MTEGFNLASKDFRAVLDKQGFIQSMSPVNEDSEKGTAGTIKKCIELRPHQIIPLNNIRTTSFRLISKIIPHKSISYWCPERESNSHSYESRGILSPLRLPVPPSGLVILEWIISTLPPCWQDANNRNQLSKFSQCRPEHTGGNGRADHARHIGGHGMHEQEIAGVFLLTDRLHHPG